jgi:Ser/Thr protein kinase RdoA (MazF antagonist)
VSTSVSSGVRSPSARLLRRWDLEEPWELAALSAAPENRNWRVVTPGGRFLLKRFADATRRQVLFRLRVTEALAAADLPVPAPIPTRDGRPLVDAAHGRYSLYPWIDGRHRDGVDLGIAECGRLGGVLGRLHTGLDRFALPVQQSLLVPATRARDAIALAGRMLAGPPEGGGEEPVESGGLDDVAAARLADRRDLLVRFADHEPPAAETVTVGYVHGGLHSGNLRYGEFTGGLVAVLGWRRLHIAPFAGELVQAASALFAHGDERGMDLERVEAFVRGHAAAFRLDAAQVQSAVHRVWWERLCDLRMLEPREDPRDGSGERRVAADIALVEWWTANLDRTLDVFAAPYGHDTGAADEADGAAGDDR